MPAIWIFQAAFGQVVNFISYFAVEASWRSGYAEDCKSLHPGSIPGEASSNKSSIYLQILLNDFISECGDFES